MVDEAEVVEEEEVGDEVVEVEVATSTIGKEVAEEETQDGEVEVG